MHIEGAFNNVKTLSVIEAMMMLKIDPIIISLINKLLGSKLIKSSLGVSSNHKVATRGTPQAEVLSPLLWNLNLN